MKRRTVLKGLVGVPLAVAMPAPALPDHHELALTVEEFGRRIKLDEARAYNYWRKVAAETVALAPRAPIISSAQPITPSRFTREALEILHELIVDDGRE